METEEINQISEITRKDFANDESYIDLFHQMN